VHRVPEGDDGQTLETIAVWFTADVTLADDLAESNGLPWAPLPAGAEVVIPQAILIPQFTRAAERAPAMPAPPGPGAATRPPAPSAPRKPAPPVKAGELTFVDDETGGYAIYRLKPKEALYSAVVVRFTGRLDPVEVSEVAKRIAKLSGITKLTSIPAGHQIRIPRDLILPEYLPPGDAARATFDAGLEAARKHRITVRARDLEGITIILDAGHGGDDIGAHHNGVYEDDYVYDILCRIKSLAEQTTGARVMSTIRDRSSGFSPLDGPFAHDRDEEILTTPPYIPRQPHVSTVGVNLRWYLVNSYYRSLLASGINPERIVFVSLHADALHPSLRGAMVYVPGQGYRGRTYGCVGRLYDRKEVEQLRYVKFSARDREVSEGLSRSLAVEVIDAFAAAGLPVHPYEPIRDHVIRMRRDWVPAVIRTSLVPQSLLLEVVNLNNARDAALMKDAAFRQRVASAFLDAVRHYYEGVSAGSRRKATASH
jgi:N-acetylmuramoyl-L-alanine amidase